MSKLTFSSKHETIQQYHACQILHRHWNFLELEFPQGHQCPLPLGLLCLQDPQSAPITLNVILTIKNKCYNEKMDGQIFSDRHFKIMD